MESNTIKPPYPYFGSKRTVAKEIWKRLGQCHNYIEPFLGGGSVLLANPFWETTSEVVNDASRFVANFWRAAKKDPDGLLQYIDWPMNETDLFARHKWLREKGYDILKQCETDPEFFDSKAAGYWAWGLSAWVGRGFCNMGVNLTRGIPCVRRCKGVFTIRDKRAYVDALCRRLSNVRVVCGDWKRCMTPSVTGLVDKGKLIGVFLDPPYKPEGRYIVYQCDGNPLVNKEVYQWCLENGDNPRFRIALCGYEGEYDLPGWAIYRWVANVGYAAVNKTGTKSNNRLKETIWFSPHCLKGDSCDMLL